MLIFLLVFLGFQFKGNQIMKGFLEKDLINGRAAYDKIQIKEVTSHYLNGCISMIIFP